MLRQITTQGLLDDCLNLITDAVKSWNALSLTSWRRHQNHWNLFHVSFRDPRGFKAILHQEAMRVDENGCNRCECERQSFELSENLPEKSIIFFLHWENRNWNWVFFFAKFDEKSRNMWSLVWYSGAICGLVELKNACQWCVLCFRIG
jgi:hypothetical protein